MGGSESKGREENGETRESSDTALANELSATALAKGAIAGAAILALGAGVASLMGYSSKMEDPVKEEKTMKAPGRDEHIPRHHFEKNNAAYFRELRNEKRKEKSLATK